MSNCINFVLNVPSHITLERRGVKKKERERVEFIACDRQCQSNCCVESLNAQVFEGALTLFIFTAQFHAVERRLHGSWAAFRISIWLLLARTLQNTSINRIITFVCSLFHFLRRPWRLLCFLVSCGSQSCTITAEVYSTTSNSAELNILTK